MKEKKDVLQYLTQTAQNLEIPDSITPNQIRNQLEQIDSITPNQMRMISEEISKNGDKKKGNYFGGGKSRLYGFLVAAACVCLLLGTSLVKEESFLHNFVTDMFQSGNGQKSVVMGTKKQNSAKILIGGGVSEDNYGVAAEETEELAETLVVSSELTYEEIYHSMFGDLPTQSKEQYAEMTEGEPMEAGIGGEIEEYAATEVPAYDGMMYETEIAEDESAGNETAYGMLKESALMEKSASTEDSTLYGTTNVQTVGVEEGDVVKNDGRFLYQVIYQEKEGIFTRAIQIIDTKDGLTEVSRIEGFENIREFYIWEDTLVVVENKYNKMVQTQNDADKELMICGTDEIEDYSKTYHEITFYNIKNRDVPQKIKTFTLKGTYESSRITEGYFYGFSRFYASMGEGEEDYAAYIPQIDNTYLKSSQIVCPKGNEGNCYLVMVSIDMANPVEFTKTMAMITDSDRYYVSNNNIYIVGRPEYGKEDGWNCTHTSLYCFSYKDGEFLLQAEGKVRGSLESSFSMDEYNGNLRVVTTVEEYYLERIRDERTKEVLRTQATKEQKSNALYVFNQELEVIGKIEHLAEDEQIYSARFLGETGYFVTFRQTDPLFSVDLKDPENPRILGELKVSGFSEYLHFFGTDRLLGIGMEADAETGSTQGMKLSMFDISTPENVQEISRLNLSMYEYSEALYNHRAVMISEAANLFGFEAEGYVNGEYEKDYLVFSYENEEFVQKLKLETNDKTGKIYSSRGTFIGDIFYLLTSDGSVQSYELNTGELLNEIK